MKTKELIQRITAGVSIIRMLSDRHDTPGGGSANMPNIHKLSREMELELESYLSEVKPQNYCQCRIIMPRIDKQAGEILASRTGWEFTSTNPESYLIKQFPESLGLNPIREVMKTVCAVVESKGILVLGARVELLVFDSRQERTNAKL